MPLDSSSRFLSPRRHINPSETQRSEYEIPRTKIHSIELELETSRVNLPNTKREIESPPKENISGFFLRDSYQPASQQQQPNVDFIQSWGNLKARIKRFNQSIHKVHWPSEE